VLSISSQLRQWRRTNNPSFSSLSFIGSIATDRVAILERRIPGGPGPADPRQSRLCFARWGRGQIENLVFA